MIAVADTVKPTAQSTIERLYDCGLTVAMITGDNTRIAQSVADALRADRVIAVVLPGDKESEVEPLLVAGYMIEGHVSLPTIERHIAGRTGIVSRAPPGMPGDSPGIGGDESTWANQPDGAVPVMVVEHDGNLTPFEL